MREDRFKFLEAMGNIDDELIYQSCQPWQKKRGSRILGFHPAKAAVCAVLVLTLCITGIFHPQVKAAIRHFTTKIAEIMGVSNDLLLYTDIIGASQTEEGVTVTLEEVILAENHLYAAFRIDWEDGLELGKDMQSPDIGIGHDTKFNGVEIATVSSEIWIPEMEADSGNSQNVLAAFVYNDDSLPYDISEVELEMQVFLTADWQGEGIPFTFHFSTSKEELQKDTFSMTVDYELKASGGAALRLQKFQFNQVFSQISARPNEIFYERMFDKGYILLGTDSEGNPLRYEMSGGWEDNLIFECIGTLPSADSEWVELQLYEAEIPSSEEEEISQDNSVTNQQTINGSAKGQELANDAIARQEDLPNGTEMEDGVGIETGKVYNVDDLDYVPVGEKIRIDFPRLSEREVKSLIAAKGGEEITWEDFSQYPCTDIGSGQYVYEYILKEGSRLYLTGSSLEELPESVYIICRDGEKEEIK